MTIALLEKVAAACHRYAAATVVVVMAITAALGAYTARNLALDTDTASLFAEDLPWLQRDREMDQLFAGRSEHVIVVIDGATPELGRAAARRLAARLRDDPDLFPLVLQPDSSDYLMRSGLMFLDLDRLEAVVDQIIAAQPLLASLAADPTARGVLDTLDLLLEGVEAGETSLEDVEPALAAVTDVAAGALAGQTHFLPWGELIAGQGSPGGLEQNFLVVVPKLDYRLLTPGAPAIRAIREAVQALDLTPENGVQVRLTGTVPLQDDEFGSVAEGAGLGTLGALVAVALLLFLAIGSPIAILAIMLTLITGLIWTAAFAAYAVGALNLISVGFAVMFIGIAVDFGIQFSLRYRDSRRLSDDPRQALRVTVRRIGGALTLAATATTVGFLAFVPTDYVGVGELGLIAGVGMVVALILNLTLLPALLSLLRPKPAAAPLGYRAAAPLDHLLLSHRRVVLGCTAVVALACLAALFGLRFDFNPLNLRNPEKESVATMRELLADPATGAWRLDVLAPDLEAAEALARRLAALPEVERALTLASFIPARQGEKLFLIEDAAFTVLPVLDPPVTGEPVSDAALRSALAHTRDLASSVAAGNAVAERMAEAFARLVDASAQARARFAKGLTAGLAPQLEALRLALQAEPVDVADIPLALASQWLTPNGRARIQITPSGDVSDNALLADFVAAVAEVAPGAVGPPVFMLNSADLVVRAFLQASGYAVLAITLLIALVLRRLRDVLLVVGPLLLSVLITLALSVAFALPINFANIIALPLLLGIGVAFNIYFVINWRAGVRTPLQSPTARAVLFSAATTAVAFGSLSLSSHPGTADMGRLLILALASTLAVTLLVLPALLGPPPEGDQSRSTAPM